MTGYVPRVVDAELDELFAALPAVVLEGPKAVGKTETALRRARSNYRLDDPAQRAIAEADPSVMLAAEPPVLIDEWQHVPPVFDAVRRAVDAGAPAGQFLLAGSAAPPAGPTHSGAGRIVTLRMRPLSLGERRLATPTVSLRAMLDGRQPPVEGSAALALRDYTREILASGFPGLRHLTGRALRAQLDGYLARVIDRDVEEQGYTVRKPETLRRWMTAYATATATTTSYEKIRDGATAGEADKPNRRTVDNYREILERLWIVDPVPGWVPSRNHLLRLIQTPKHHMTDPALAARLLGMDEGALLAGATGPATPRDGTLLGQLFESLVTLSIRVYAQAAEARVRHMRTDKGRREIDIIVERSDHRVLAVEVKLSGKVTDDDVKHLLWLRERLGEDVLDAMVVTTGPQAFRRSDGVAVVPAVLLGP